ncbi:MAG TPA: nucleoside-diphosphate kinase [Phycisphaerae bacterium]|nr:nucleoside-diphosphate kinase [Phycisphaerae bacterium]HOI56379.1 nucleoside-diphosphate kinase [Phycisphaerae bacterium]
MADQLAYLMITPYSLSKSRTGAIISRVISLVQAELVGAYMFSPSDAFVDRFKAGYETCPGDDPFCGALVSYVDENLRKVNPLGITNRTMVLLFRGENVVEHLRRDVVGSARPDVAGDTVRGSFGDFLVYPNGEVKYFEPAVLCALDEAGCRNQLKVFSDFAPTDGGVIEDAVKFSDPANVETSLVILKPDNFYKRSRRAGNIIDIFSKTGLFIVGAKVLSMSVAQGEEFYGPLKDMFREKLVGRVVETVHERLNGAFDFEVPAQVSQKVGAMLADVNAVTEFSKIVEYMTGVDPRAVGDAERNAPGKMQCLALLYRGKNAIEKIRKWLGATDPSKADLGTVRSDFGRDLMRNAAHASDSVANAERERKIIGLWRTEPKSEFKRLLDAYLAQ